MDDYELLRFPRGAFLRVDVLQDHLANDGRVETFASDLAPSTRIA